MPNPAVQSQIFEPLDPFEGTYRLYIGILYIYRVMIKSNEIGTRIQDSEGCSCILLHESEMCRRSDVISHEL